MRVLVCGGRDFQDYELVKHVLDRLPQVTFLIHGDARGADSLAKKWALEDGTIEILSFPADWKRKGRMAGVLRNHDMIVKGHPDLVVAFEGGKGTADMVFRAKQAGVPVRKIKRGDYLPPIETPGTPELPNVQ